MSDDMHRADGGDWEEELLADLIEAGRLETVPVEAAAAAKSGFAWRTMEDELAELSYDSSVAEDALAGVRSGAATARLLTFESAGLTVEIEVMASANGSRRRIVGQLVPTQAGRVEVRHGGGAVTAEADELGRFSVDDLEPGPVSLRCAGASGPVVVTDWVLL